MPKISIILPVYRANIGLLREAIDSVLSQSFIDFELLIIDDASERKGIDAYLQSLPQQDARIKCYKNAQNLNLPNTLNRGIELAQSEFIARIDQDDLWIDREKLQKQIDFFVSHSEYVLCGTNVVLLDMTGNEVQKVIQQESDIDIRNRMLMSTQFAHASVMFRRDIAQELGGYNPAYNLMEDHEFWLRMGLRYKFHNIQDFCLGYRVNPEGMSLKNRKSQQKLALQLAQEYKKSYPGAYRGIFANLVNYYLPNRVIHWINLLNRITGKPII